MEIDVATGMLYDVRYVPSPNYNERPTGTVIDLLVIHNMSLPPGEFGGPHIDALFTNVLDSSLHPYFAEISGLEVSSHCLIRRDGKIVQYVPFNKRAWHAGDSCFEERENCNDFSIGIELEGTDEIPYTPIQYDILADLVVLLKKTYPGITDNRVVGHSTIAPVRKTDPGSVFDWDLLAKLSMKKECSGENNA
ncbi:MAG TPA: 1,6-anhydro-N-acetylmuramyl-L-alanine amidase AmpD [Gammaproteobacteria bacterium]|nr:1,6-anhydro-N-acetylmuramyl-L-alanine amidase AmpD [Gammaproteobacteria bacterium]